MELKQKDRNTLFLWMFDFDGVLCDSQSELCTVALKATKKLWKEYEDTWNEFEDEKIYKEFEILRPYLETGWESILIVRVIFEALQRKAKYTENDHFPYTYHDIKTNFSEIRGSLLSYYDFNEQELKESFRLARQEWINTDRTNWVNAHSYYDDAIQAVASLIGKEQNEVCIITTKGKEFVLDLLQHSGLMVHEDNVFGLGSGTKIQVIEQILGRYDDILRAGTELHASFFEDRLQTLLGVQSSALDGIVLNLAGWGYNTEDDYDTAIQNGINLLSNQSDLIQYIQSVLEMA